MALTEFAAIDRFFRRAGLAFDQAGIALGIGDDCALLQCQPGMQIAVSMDMLQEHVHFPADADPFLLAQRALLVNLSDLAAVGAEPVGFTLGLSLPALDETWLEAFSAGLAKIATAYACPLIGGDTTQGPLSICIQVHGRVPEGSALRRDGARAGDLICVTGTLGNAGAALRLLPGSEAVANTAESVRDSLLAAYYTPQARVEAGQRLRGLATAAIDISDGLASDLRHILRASGLCAQVKLDSLPLSDAFLALIPPEERVALALGAGDDYELCLTLPEANLAEATEALGQAGVRLSCIGKVLSVGECDERQPGGIDWLDGAGCCVELKVSGYTHFAVKE